MQSLPNFQFCSKYILAEKLWVVVFPWAESKGLPVLGVKIKLEKYNNQSKIWTFVDEKNTDTNGRISDFLPSEKDNLGIFKLTYFTSDYFKKNNTESFYPFIEVVFEIKDKNHYHVPITLSAYGYSTYRGS
ncbi:hydroxyisourate hydrolase [Chryseobacterium carnipullorum]|uniref:5-hydroxyisourate hydrolase n=1 Tax=Chryseobacterium carnipullorum TaxID=1124835 RepID=A0A3G6M8Y0_CHRCU|nr:hydroxyisourate hydrolase [Chryseobacterium carnipullorum]AZA67685.1 hydroxyisourate hydrolase [Chryseobacterium carnipullorum]